MTHPASTHRTLEFPATVFRFRKMIARIKDKGCTIILQQWNSHIASLRITSSIKPVCETNFKRGEIKRRAMNNICCFITKHARDQQQPETQRRPNRTCTIEDHIPSSVGDGRFTFEPGQVRSSLIYRPAIEGTDEPIVGSHASIKGN